VWFAERKLRDLPPVDPSLELRSNSGSAHAKSAAVSGASQSPVAATADTEAQVGIRQRLSWRLR
jgi:hypothetical protein